ncbi:MAG: NADH-quinone oxidoreductase subunit C, partial [Desulfobacterales bacterium]
MTFQVKEDGLKKILRFLKTEALPRFRRLEDLTAIDESARRPGQSYPDYSLVYSLLSFEPARRLRLKVPLWGNEPVTQSITDIWPSANWYEREVFDMFGIRFEGHENLRRILMPHDWEGHPLRKSHPGRATKMPPFTRNNAIRHQPLDGGVYVRRSDTEEELVLNIGPHHVSTHGLMRFIVALKGEEIVD